MSNNLLKCKAALSRADSSCELIVKPGSSGRAIETRKVDRKQDCLHAQKLYSLVQVDWEFGPDSGSCQLAPHSLHVLTTRFLHLRTKGSLGWPQLAETSLEQTEWTTRMIPLSETGEGLKPHRKAILVRNQIRSRNALIESGQDCRICGSKLA